MLSIMLSIRRFQLVLRKGRMTKRASGSGQLVKRENGLWSLVVSVSGKRSWISLGTANKTEARRLATNAIAELQNGKPPPEEAENKTSFKDVMELFRKRVPQAKYTTLEGYGTSWRQFTAIMRSRRVFYVEHVGKLDAESYTISPMKAHK